MNLTQKRHDHQGRRIGDYKGRDGGEVYKGYVRDLPDLKSTVNALTWPFDLAALKYDRRRPMKRRINRAGGKLDYPKHAISLFGG